jgi:hypothetical protein
MWAALTAFDMLLFSQVNCHFYLVDEIHLAAYGGRMFDKNRTVSGTAQKAQSVVRGAKEQVTCACGTVFFARTADRKRGWGKFCSKSCKARVQEKRTGQHARHQRKIQNQYGGVDRETYLHYQNEYGGIPQFDRRGEYTGFVMSQEDLSYGGHGDADWDTPFGDGKH